MSQPGTIVDKLWDAHVVETPGRDLAVVYVDLHLVHEVTSPPAFSMLEQRGLPVRCPERTVGTVDHIVPTDRADAASLETEAARLVGALEDHAEAEGVPVWGLGSPRQGIVHVTAPEQGLVRPGMTIVCGDSHTTTLGAFGTLAFGIGTTEIAHVLATQTLVKRRPATLEVRLEGALPRGVVAKDVALAVVRALGVDGAAGHAIEYRGSLVEALDVPERMTLCNMAIEAGARAAVVAPDERTFDYLDEHEAVEGEREEVLERWRAWNTDPEAVHDRSITLDVSSLEPLVTYGTTPAMSVGVREPVPDPADPPAHVSAAALERALDYMELMPGEPILGQSVDVVFVGSCTNARLTDLRAAARVLRGEQVAKGVQMLVVPGSQHVKQAAEREGLDRVFEQAGAEWREPGCSMCIAMNDDRLEPGALAVSTTNRNFEGRQGPGGRTVLASPPTAAASAVEGAIADPREPIAEVPA